MQILVLRNKNEKCQYIISIINICIINVEEGDIFIYHHFYFDKLR